jgi:hypothetical protein
MGVVDTLKEKAIEYGIPWEIVYSIVGVETGGTFDVTSLGDSGESWGLFQINYPTHQDFDITKYTDVSYQADYQLPELVSYYKKGYEKGLRGSDLARYVEVYGQRPDYSNDNKTYIDSAITKYYNQATSGNIVNPDISSSSSSSSSSITSTNSSNSGKSWTDKVVSYLGEIKDNIKSTINDASNAVSDAKKEVKTAVETRFLYYGIIIVIVILIIIMLK